MKLIESKNDTLRNEPKDEAARKAKKKTDKQTPRAKKQTNKRAPKKRTPKTEPSQGSAGTAQQIAAELAAEHGLDISKPQPLTDAERRARRREKMTPVSLELPHEIAAKLVVLAAAEDTTQRQIVETLIEQATIGGVLD